MKYYRFFLKSFLFMWSLIFATPSLFSLDSRKLLEDAIKNNHTGAIKKMLSEGAFDINGKLDAQETSPLLMAVQYGSLQTAEYLLSKAADPNQTNAEGLSPLLAAVQSADLNFINLLLKYKASVNAGLLLDTAIRDGNYDIVKRLIEAGASLSQYNTLGFTPLITAIYANDHKSLALLLKAGADAAQPLAGETTTPLEIALYNEDFTAAAMLLNYGADIDTVVDGSNGYTLLFYSVLTNNLKTAEFCLQNGANIFCYDSSGRGLTHYTRYNEPMQKLINRYMPQEAGIIFSDYKPDAQNN
jgi:ankyrin repeat protein